MPDQTYHPVLAVNVAQTRDPARTPGWLMTACARGGRGNAGNPAQTLQEPIMTVLFDIRGAQWTEGEDGACLPPPKLFVNIANSNARDFLDWLGLPNEDLCGEMPARELAARLRRRLWPERRAIDDDGRDGFVDCRPGRAILISCGREPGRLAAYAERLLALCEHAGDGTIVWS